MNLPAKVRVGAWDYRIEAFSFGDGADSGKFGTCSTNQKLIQIDLHWGAKRAAATLLHEIVHAVWSEWNMEKEDEEERIVRCVADGLSAVWRDNPEVMRWIHRRLGA